MQSEYNITEFLNKLKIVKEIDPYHYNLIIEIYNSLIENSNSANAFKAKFHEFRELNSKIGVSVTKLDYFNQKLIDAKKIQELCIRNTSYHDIETNKNYTNVHQDNIKTINAIDDLIDLIKIEIEINKENSDDKRIKTNQTGDEIKNYFSALLNHGVSELQLMNLLHANFKVFNKFFRDKEKQHLAKIELINPALNKSQLKQFIYYFLERERRSKLPVRKRVYATFLIKNFSVFFDKSTDLTSLENLAKNIKFYDNKYKFN